MLISISELHVLLCSNHSPEMRHQILYTYRLIPRITLSSRNQVNKTMTNQGMMVVDFKTST